MPTTINYNLQKLNVIKNFKASKIAITEICDAQPELMRPATYVGRKTFQPCPICSYLAKEGLTDLIPSFASFTNEPVDEYESLRELTYLYGDSLRQRQGHLVESSDELFEYSKRYDSFWAWTVEVCITCRWNHIVNRQQLGTQHS